MKVAITGAGGFVGRALVAHLRGAGDDVLPIVRAPTGIHGEQAIGAIEDRVEWAPVLAGAEALVHLAARVHVMRDSAGDPLSAYRRVNSEATRALARAAATSGVRRFLYLSTVKVHGEATPPGRPFRADQPPAPSDPYAISKYEAEQGLAEVSAETGMEVVVIRPPLIHGPGVGGNLASMIAWLRRGVPLPLGSVTGNRRSLIGIDNLVDLIGHCLSHPAATQGPWLASDGPALSTRRLLELMAEAMGRKPRLATVPPQLLDGALKLAGLGASADRLLGSLEIDMADTMRALDWRPPVSLEEGLAKMVAG